MVTGEMVTSRERVVKKTPVAGKGKGEKNGNGHEPPNRNGGGPHWTGVRKAGVFAGKISHSNVGRAGCDIDDVHGDGEYLCRARVDG